MAGSAQFRHLRFLDANQAEISQQQSPEGPPENASKDFHRCADERLKASRKCSVAWRIPASTSRALQFLLERESNMKRINCLLLRLGFTLTCVALLGGCGRAGPAAIRKPSQDHSLRYIGPRGAVAVVDNLGHTKHLPPGTPVRAIRDTFPTPAGPMKIYVVTEGSLGGSFVPLGEHDLAPQ